MAKVVNHEKLKSIEIFAIYSLSQFFPWSYHNITDCEIRQYPKHTSYAGTNHLSPVLIHDNTMAQQEI